MQLPVISYTISGMLTRYGEEPAVTGYKLHIISGMLTRYGEQHAVTGYKLHHLRDVNTIWRATCSYWL